MRGGCLFMPHSTFPLDSGGACLLALRNQGERSTKAFHKTIKDFREFACIAPFAPPLLIAQVHEITTKNESGST